MYKLRITYTKEQNAKFIPFNYLTKVFERTLRRVGVPLSFSEGYNKHIRISFGPAVPLGISCKNEVFDIILQEKIIPEIFKEKMNMFLPSGMELKECRYIDISDKISSINKALYTIKKIDVLSDYAGPWEIVNEDTQTLILKINLLGFKHKILFDKFGMENIIERNLIVFQNTISLLNPDNYKSRQDIKN